MTSGPRLSSSGASARPYFPLAEPTPLSYTPHMDINLATALPIETLDLLGHGVCVLSTEGDVLSANRALAEMGVALVTGEPWPELPEELAAAMEGVLAGGAACVVERAELALAEGRRGTFRVVAIPSSGGGATLVLQEARPDARIVERFERILDSTPDGFFVIDADRRVALFNRACGEITGRDPREVVRDACECSDVIHCHTEEGESYATSLCPAKAVFGGERAHQREEMLLTNSAGQERWIETTYSPVLNAEGEVEYVIGILRDVHDRKLLEERLRQTEKLATLGRLIAGVAHEIRNPLAIIQSSLDIIENPARPAEQREEAGCFLRAEVRRLDERLRAFLAFARPRDIRLAPMVLAGLARDRAASLAVIFPGIKFHLEASTPEPIIMADAEALNQVLSNFVMNAGEALEGPGNITIRTRQQGDFALLEVEDDGPGVPADHAARVFDPFFTTKPEGTGLGLSICYQITLAHRGSISIARGRNGRGACFTLRLPMARRFEGGTGNGE